MIDGHPLDATQERLLHRQVTLVRRATISRVHSSANGAALGGLGGGGGVSSVPGSPINTHLPSPSAVIVDPHKWAQITTIAHPDTLPEQNSSVPAASHSQQQQSSVSAEATITPLVADHQPLQPQQPIPFNSVVPTDLSPPPQQMA